MTGPEPEDRFWYLTLYNENYPMPALPTDPAEAERVRLGTVKGMYRFAEASGRDGVRRAGPCRDAGRATILFSGLGLAGGHGGPRLLADDWGVDAEAWSVTSYKSLREDAISVERRNRLHPGEPTAGPLRDRVPGRVGRARSWPSPTSCGPSPTRCSRWMPRASPRSAPTGSAAPTPGRSCAGSSRWTPPTSWWPSSRAWSPRRPGPAASVAEAIDRYGIDAGVPGPLVGS